ncbi:MAG: fimbrillin family protein [Bacteroidaceae bacterium]|nr:fimbrillin family protein [Bacteroidaceae bacterium]
MKKIVSLMTIALGLLSVVSCKDEAELLPGDNPTSYGSGIRFSASMEDNETRTQYADNDWRQLEWKEGDKVTIFCDQTKAPDGKGGWAKKTSAVYEIKKGDLIAHEYEVNGQKIKNNCWTNLHPESDKKDPVLNKETEALYWGSDAGQHTFYACYGKGVSVDETSGKVNCSYNPMQILEYDQNRNECTNADYAYMVSKKIMTPDDVVSMAFDPIMTTLQVEVQGPATGNVVLSAMEITLPKECDVINMDGTFAVTCNSGGFDVVASTEAQKEETYVFLLKDPLPLQAGQSVKFTIFLPPVKIQKTDEVKLSIVATDASCTSKISNVEVPAGGKFAIKAPEWVKKDAAAQEGKDWVDLGLGVKWATRNIGASTPEEAGGYFGWGCTAMYATSGSSNWGVYWQYLRNYTGTNATICGTANDPLQQYVYDGKGVTNKNWIIAGTEWDAARVRLGGKWRMPTREELQKLGNYGPFDGENTKWVWDASRNGYRVISKVAGYEGQEIFLPWRGVRQPASIHSSQGGYWTCSNGGAWSASNGSEQNAYFMYYQQGNVGIASGNNKTDMFMSAFPRLAGCLIRPVYDSEITVGVDLGLSVLWADQNVGAQSPEQQGHLYGWGCIEPYGYQNGKPVTETADWATYWKKLGSTATKDTDCGTSADPLQSITDISGNAKFDAARAYLKGPWRMPTESEIAELFDASKCKWTAATVNGVAGYWIESLVTGYTGNKIFLPRVNYNYWGATHGQDDQKGVGFDNTSKNFYLRYNGCAIRPVCPRTTMGSTIIGYGAGHNLLQ